MGRAALVALWVVASSVLSWCGGGGGPVARAADGGAGPGAAAGEATLARRREAMVARQIAARGVTDGAVLAAMRAVPRHRFVNPEDLDAAYDDRPLGIGLGQTISQPYVVAAMTAALAPGAGDRVLEIGTGSGYQAAVLGRLAREVYTVEIVPALAARAARTLRGLGVTNVRVRAGDGYLGWPEAAPFQGIMITAATPRIPQPLVSQLAEGGRLVAPVDEGGDQVLVRYVKRQGRLTPEKMFPVRFVPMTGKVRE